jgi:hypothetical protein
MTIDELVPLTNGLSVSACGQTLVCDRARITPLQGDAFDMSFWIAGTDYVPRLRLTRTRLANQTPEKVARIVSQVARRAVCG